MASCGRAGLCEDPALHQPGAGAIAGQLGLQAWRGRHVLKAMGLGDAATHSVRISLSHLTTAAEIARLTAFLCELTP